MAQKAFLSMFFAEKKGIGQPGVTWKLYDHDWQPGGKVRAAPTPEQVDAQRRWGRGERLERHELPEAGHVWDEKKFARTKDIFFQDGFVVVRQRLADALRAVDLGETTLEPYPIYGPDKATLLDEPFWLLNFGAQKNTFMPERSQNVRAGVTNKKTGIRSWSAKFAVRNGDIRLNEDALAGPSLWMEATVRHDFFMTDDLVRALKDHGVKANFSLYECSIEAGV